jgi:hypothetical protein
MNERKLRHGSGINTADEATLEGSVGPNVFESLDDGLVRKGGRANVGRTGGAPMWVRLMEGWASSLRRQNTATQLDELS